MLKSAFWRSATVSKKVTVYVKYSKDISGMHYCFRWLPNYTVAVGLCLATLKLNSPYFTQDAIRDIPCIDFPIFSFPVFRTIVFVYDIHFSFLSNAFPAYFQVAISSQTGNFSHVNSEFWNSVIFHVQFPTWQWIFGVLKNAALEKIDSDSKKSKRDSYWNTDCLKPRCEIPNSQQY